MFPLPLHISIMDSIRSCFSTSLFTFTQGLSLDRHLHRTPELETRILLVRRPLPKVEVTDKVRSSVVTTLTVDRNQLEELPLLLEEIAIALMAILHFAARGTLIWTEIIRIMIQRDNERDSSLIQNIPGDQHGEICLAAHLLVRLNRNLFTQTIAVLVSFHILF